MVFLFQKNNHGSRTSRSQIVEEDEDEDEIPLTRPQRGSSSTSAPAPTTTYTGGHNHSDSATCTMACPVGRRSMRMELEPQQHHQIQLPDRPTIDQMVTNELLGEPFEYVPDTLQDINRLPQEIAELNQQNESRELAREHNQQFLSATTHSVLQLPGPPPRGFRQ